MCQGLGIHWFHYTKNQIHLWIQNINCHEVKTSEAMTLHNAGLNFDQAHSALLQ